MALAKDATQAPASAQEDIVNTVIDGEASVAPGRFFTIPGRDPFDEVGVVGHQPLAPDWSFRGSGQLILATPVAGGCSHVPLLLILCQ